MLHRKLSESERRALQDEIELSKELAKRKSKDSLVACTRLIWPIIEPANRYQHNWHIDAVADHLAAVRNFEIDKLIINMPPRCMKSILVSMGFNVWVWLTEPSRRFIYASYAQSLSDRDALKARTVIEHPMFQETFKPKWELRDDQNQKRRFENTETGFRFSTSVGGTLTGEGGDYLIADDPQNAMDIYSLPYRDETYRFFEAFASRANNQKKVGRVIVQQRLHEDDVSGRLMAEKKGYQVLVLPMEYDPKVISYNKTKLNPQDPRTTLGEPLWRGRFDLTEVQELKRLLGDSAHAQLQQDPKPKDGGLFKRHWWQTYFSYPDPIKRIVQFWDCAQKPGLSNDFSVCATWAETDKGYFLLDLWREKTTGPILEEMAKTKYNQFRPNAVVIEDKSAGSSLIQYLRTYTTMPVIAWDPGQRDKEIRAIAATPTVQAGKMFLPESLGENSEGKCLLEIFLNEHERFPKSTNDDTVDTTSMAVSYFTQPVATPRVRGL